MSKQQGLNLAIRSLIMVLGLALLATGILASVKANLGTSAWTVFHLGIAQSIGWTQGQVSQAVGLIIILLSFFLGIKPAIATLCNMFLVGRFYDLFNAADLLPEPGGVPGRVLLLVASVYITAVGTSMYISVNLGAGPRDGLMLALTRRSGWNIGLVRNSIEIIVLAAGVLLGGPFGLGTLCYALAIGPALELNLHLLRRVTAKFHLEHIFTVPESKRRKQSAMTKTGDALFI